MNLLRASLLALSLAACGSAVVVPTTEGDASPRDAATPPPGDAALPPARDAAPVDTALPPPPPRDAGEATITARCELACARLARECGGSSRPCVDECASIEGAPGAERCVPEIRAAIDCLVTDGFTCNGGAGQPAATCAPRFGAVQNCLAGNPPPPRPDAGPPPPLPAACGDYCALSERACMAPSPSCREDCATAVSQLSRECAVRFAAIVGCIGQNPLVCQNDLAQPPAACRVLLDAFRPCGMGATTDGGVDDGGSVEPVDAGEDPPTPIDAGGADV